MRKGYKLQLVESETDYKKLEEFVEKERRIYERLKQEGYEPVIGEHLPFLSSYSFDEYVDKLNITKNTTKTDVEEGSKNLGFNNYIQREFMFTLTTKGEIIGYGLHSSVNYHSTQDLTYAAIEHRGNGFFHLLMEGMEDYAKKFKYPFLKLKVENGLIREALKKKGYEEERMSCRMSKILN